MNSEIEQRIVAMYFDNKDFEKNAQQTIGTLGQLKEGLNLEDSVKGFDELDKAGKKLNLNQARTSVTNLKNAMGGLGTAVQKAFNIGTAPIHALDNFFGTFRSYVGKFVGFDLASKFVNSLESAIRELTVAPIQAGWNMYQANVDSVKTIMSGTAQSYSDMMSKTNSDWTYNEAEHMEFVKGHLRELSDYAAKTVFSLQDMTSNIGKFTNQGVDLETSVTAMEGIANMTAKAGQSAQQASMAMYNFSQALGVGKMTTIDWKSIENANIATMELKNNFLQVAAAAGNLKKEVKTIDGKEVEQFFYTLDKNGKQLARNKWVEVSAENFRETLQHGWLDKETMLRVMQLYSGQGFDLDTLASWGFDIKDTELMEQLKAVGEEALEAATQVRTFQKMWDALTESVQSSWADSMELIFGDMTEATTFWTEINDKVGGVMDKIGKDRNNLLREWRGESWDEESQAWIKLDDAVDGREDLIQGIYGIIDAANSLGSAFSAAWSDVFGNITGETLQNITRGFREFVDSFKEWLGEVNDSDSRINKIRSGLSGVFSVLKLVWEVVKNMFGVLKQVIKPLIDPLINLFDKFGQWLKLDNVKNLGDMLGLLRDRFGQLWSKISGLGWSGVLGKIGDWLGNLWAEIRNGVTNFLQENGLGGVVDWFVSIGDSIKAGFDSVVEWWNSDENKISGFFKGIWESVTGWFKPTVDDRGNEVRSPIVQFFYRIRDGVTEAFEAVKAWWKESRIPEFFQGIWDAITGIFKGRSGSDFIPEGYNGNVDLLTRPKVKIEAVTEAGWVDEDGNPLGGDYATVLTNTFSVGDEKKGFDFSYNENAVINITPILADGRVLSPEALEDYMAEITAEAKRTGKTIKEVDAEQYGLILSYDVVPDDTSLDEAYEKAGEWAEKLHDLQEQWDDTGRTEEEAPIVKFFNDTWSSLRDTFTDIMSWPIWGQIGTFFSNLWTTLTKIFTPKDQYDDRGFLLNEKGNSPFVQFFVDTWEGIKAAYEEVKSWGIWSEIGGFFSGVWEKLSGIFQPKLVSIDYDGTGRHETYGPSPFAQFFIDTWDGIKAAFEEVKNWEIWKTIGGFFAGVWDTISSLFEPKLVSIGYDGTGRHETYGPSPFAQFFIDTWDGIKAAFEEVKSWEIWKTIGGFFEGVWNTISEIFQPKLVDIQYDGTGRHEFYGDAPIVKFFKDAWEGIKNVFTEVANWWNDPDNAISGFFKNIWSSITGLFNGTGDVAEEVGDAAEKINDAAENAAPSGTSAEQTHKSLGIIGEFIDKVKSFITEVIDKVAGVEIPPQIETFFKGLGDFLLGVANIIGEIIGRLGRTLAGEGSAGDVITVVLGTIAMIATQIFDFIHTKDLGKIETQSFGQKFMSFSIGLLAMAAAIALLSTIEPEKMWPAVAVLAAMGIVIGAILYFANNIQALASVEAAQSTMSERLVGKLIDALKMVGTIAVALALLPEVIRAFGEAKKLAPELNGDDLMKTFLGLAGFVAATSVVLGILQKLTANRGLDPVVALKTGLAIAAFFGSLIAGFGAIGGAIGIFQSLSDQVQGAAAGSSAKANQKALLDAGETIKSLMSIVRGFWEGLSGAQTDGQKVESAQSILLEMAQQLEVFTAEKTSGLLRVLNLIGTLSQIVSDVPDADKLSSFATTLGPLADGIAKFSFIMSGFTDENMQQFAYWNPDNLEAQVKNVEAVFRAFSHIDGSLSAQTASQFLNGIKFLNENMSADDFKAFGHIVTGIVDSFDQAISTDGDAMGTMADSLMTNLSKAIKIGLSGNGADVVGAFDATPIVDSIVVALGYGETTIAAAVHDMVQAGLNSSATGKDGKIGYNFDDGFLSGLMSFIQNPEELLGGETGNGLNDMLYGVGGTAENPKEGSIFGQILGITGQMEGIEFPNMAEKLTKSMKMTDADGNPIDLIGDLRETLTNFETELNETSAFEIKIVPTYDFSNLNAETLRNQLKDYPVRIPMMSPSGGGYSIPETVQIDFTGINAALDLDGLKNRLDNINVAVDANGRAMVDAINSMGSHIDRISAAISQIKVYVDMYGMIPKIDKALGDRASKSAATGVSSMLGNPYQYVNNPVSLTE